MAATKALPLKIDELLVDIFYHFHHSVNRITSLKEFADFYPAPRMREQGVM